MDNFTSTTGRALMTLVSLVAFFTVPTSLQAQVIKPYSSIYSNSVKGGHTMFGNTITAIYSSGSGSTGTVNTTAMNDFGSYSNGNTSQYGNDGSNIQWVDVDGVNSDVALVAYGGTNVWKYYSLNNYSSAPANISGNNWKQDAYSEATNWTSVSAPFGFGESGTNPPTQTNRHTYYLRRDINISNPSQYASIRLTAKYDDGFVIYVNGTEVARANMDGVGATPAYSDDADGTREYDDGDFVVTIPASSFANGNNQIAVEIHQGSNSTTDIYYDMKLDGIPTQTFNSSSADLVMPAGTNTIKFARLYWGGRINSGMGVNNNNDLRTIKIRKGTSGAYTTFTTASTLIDKTVVSGTDSAYQSYLDVTSFLSSNGAGTYTIADIVTATGSVTGGGYYGGWGIVVVYENLSLPYSSVRVYDGFVQVYNGGSSTNQSITLTGLNVPSNPLVSSDAYMTTMAWEGDANLAASASTPAGDYIKVNGYTVGEGVRANAVNPATNMWNGTISKNGAHITTKSPNYKNQMGIDIDEVEVGVNYGILGNATSVSVEFGTEADQYFPSVFAFTMRTKDPTVVLDKTVSDAIAPFGVLQTNETLTYTLSGVNNGPGIAYKTMIVDTLPTNITYVPGSLKVLYAPGFSNDQLQTDAIDGDFAFKSTNGGKEYVKFFIGTGKTSTQGGQMLAGETYAVSFQAKTPSQVNQVTTVTNTARIIAEGISGELFTDDGFVAIGPSGATTPVKMISFNGKKEGLSALLKWSTANEFENHHFDIERSTDAVNFIKVGTVAGSGTVTTTRNYQFTDPISGITAKVIYYRLRIVDMDGKNTFSQIVAVRLDGVAMDAVNLYPNPFTSNIKLQLRSVKEEDVTVRLITSSGQIAIKRAVTLQPGDNLVVIKDLETLAPGMYVLEMQTSGGTVSQQIIKVKN
jgi:uncharacterized repeat protein (TIGR01451 family)